MDVLIITLMTLLHLIGICFLGINECCLPSPGGSETITTVAESEYIQKKRIHKNRRKRTWNITAHFHLMLMVMELISHFTCGIVQSMNYEFDNGRDFVFMFWVAAAVNYALVLVVVLVVVHGNGISTPYREGEISSKNCNLLNDFNHLINLFEFCNFTIFCASLLFIIVCKTLESCQDSTNLWLSNLSACYTVMVILATMWSSTPVFSKQRKILTKKAAAEAINRKLVRAPEVKLEAICGHMGHEGKLIFQKSSVSSISITMLTLTSQQLFIFYYLGIKFSNNSKLT